jgi:hypothetical protein
VLFPTHTTSTSLGIRKYSSVRASANEFGGMMHSSTRHVDERAVVEALRVHHHVVDVGEDLELRRHADVVPVGLESP